MHLFFTRKGVVKKYFLDVTPPGIQFLRFFWTFSRVNSRIPNARIFQQTILELSHGMGSKNLLHTFETFLDAIAPLEFGY